MRRYFPVLSFLIAGAACAAGWAVSQGVADTPDEPATLEALGERLFFDVNLSANRTQACATCHNPEFGFSDPRGMASLGDDGESLGDRNAPTATYAAFTPLFHRTDEGKWVGGQFVDGRSSALEDQAGEPPLNPAEMGMPDKDAVVARLREDPVYQTSFPKFFETGILDDTEKAYGAMTKAVAAFERTDTFSPFDSRYDRYLRGEVKLTEKEELGRVLFFSQQFTNCNQCHQLGKSAIDPRETFTDYSYHNIGVPENLALRAQNGVAPDTVDEGLAANPQVDGDPKERGKFRTPTLRNVAVTGPYMHNGVFKDLRTVILFYNQYNTKSEKRRINPETGKPFRASPVPETVSKKELTDGPALDDQKVDALVAFLKTLTDARYEHLIGE